MTSTLKVCLLLISLAYLGCATLAPLVETSAEAIEGEYIVVFKNGASLKAVETQVAQAKAFIGSENMIHEFSQVIQGFAAKLNPEQLNFIRKNPSVDFVEVNSVVEADVCTSFEAGSWGQSRVAQKTANYEGFPYHATSTGGKGVTAYIVDTGVFIQHTEFEGRATFGFKAEEKWSDKDMNGHGTHVASTIGGKIYGIAKNVDIVAVKVLGDSGSGSFAGIISGVEYVAQQHKKKGKSVANMSLGGGKSLALNSAIATAVGQGVVFVVSGGNNNYDSCRNSPASEESAITTGATTKTDTRSTFSNFGPCIDIFAPGTDIKGAWIGDEKATKTISGTSMAAPHITGLSALILGDKETTPENVKTILKTVGHKGIINLNCNGDATCLKSPNILAYNGCN